MNVVVFHIGVHADHTGVGIVIHVSVVNCPRRWLFLIGASRCHRCRGRGIHGSGRIRPSVRTHLLDSTSSFLAMMNKRTFRSKVVSQLPFPNSIEPTVEIVPCHHYSFVCWYIAAEYAYLDDKLCGNRPFTVTATVPHTDSQLRTWHFPFVQMLAGVTVKIGATNEFE